MRIRVFLTILSAAGALVLTACATSSPVSGDVAAAPTAPVALASPTTPSDSTPATSPAVPVSTAPAPGKVSANTATQEQLTQAFTAAGIPNAARWAVEVVEYRPYPASDPNFSKLRQNLAKYNPPADVVEKIVATLAP